MVGAANGNRSSHIPSPEGYYAEQLGRTKTERQKPTVSPASRTCLFMSPSLYNSNGDELENIRCGFRFARSNMVCANTPFAHANQLRVYEVDQFTSILSCISPNLLAFSTSSIHPVISSSSSEVCAWTNKLIGQAFCSPM